MSARAGRPRRWYFSGKDGSVLRKRNDKLENKRIYEAVVSKVGKSPVVCNCIKYEGGWGDDHTPINVSFKFIPLAELSRSLLIIERQVFGEESRHATDILTTYISSYEEQANTYCVHWTPSISTTEKYINVAKKPKMPFERYSTFEGPSTLCKLQTTISAKVTEQLNRALY